MVVRGRVTSIVLVPIGIAYLVDLFLRWGPKGEYEVDGVHTLAYFSLFTGIALVLWELLGAIGIRRTARSDSLVGFFLAAGTSLIAVVAIVHLRWGEGFGPFEHHGLGYGAWVAIPLAALLLAGAIVHAFAHGLSNRGPAPMTQ